MKCVCRGTGRRRRCEVKRRGPFGRSGQRGSTMTGRKSTIVVCGVAWLGVALGACSSQARTWSSTEERLQTDRQALVLGGSTEAFADWCERSSPKEGSDAERQEWQSLCQRARELRGALMKATYPREDVLMGRGGIDADAYYANLEPVVSRSLDEYKQLQKTLARLQAIH